MKSNKIIIIFKNKLFYYFFISGYFRVIYDDKILGNIIENINKGTIDEFTTGQVLIDHFEGALAGVVSFDTALNLLETVLKKNEPNCRKAIYNVLNKLEIILHSTNHHDKLMVIVNSILLKYSKTFFEYFVSHHEIFYQR